MQVIHEIACCKFIISSSLHGLIIAHSLGIPTVAFEIQDTPLRGGRFKFRDYYSAYGLDPVFYSLQGDEKLKELCREGKQIDPCRIRDVKRNVLRAFAGLAENKL